MQNTIFLSTILAVALSASAREALPKITIGEIGERQWTSNRVELTGRITAIVQKSRFSLSDAVNTIWVSSDTPIEGVCGDTIRAKVLILRQEAGDLGFYAEETDVLQHEPKASIPIPTSIHDLAHANLHYRMVAVTGTVTDVFTDEIDPTYTLITLESEESSALLSFRKTVTTPRNLRSLIDTEVRVNGISLPDARGFRRHLKIATLAIDPETSIQPLPPAERGLPHREIFRGTALAAFEDRAFYLATDDGRRIKVYLERGRTPPLNGQRVEAAGFVRKNVFFTTLSNSRLTVLSEPTTAPETPVEISSHDLLYDRSGQRKIKAQYEGRPVRIVGTVISASEAGTPDGRITILDDGIATSVRIGRLTPPPLASEVSATGICSIDCEADGNLDGFVRLTGFSLIARSADDLVILRYPPWWTPLKLFAVIATLLVTVVAVLIWNRALRILAERRGRELMSEQIGRVTSDLRVNERTRIAVELHDALSQNLTGVSLQLDAVRRFAEDDRPKMFRHLDIATRTLKSCRDELRNCLWDLRNRALEEKDLNEAIRRTVSPFVGDAELRIRFNVPRDQISDNTAHALMRIIRELASNAVRHGQSKTIRIAGAIENGRLLFSVSDDGCGFDPENHLGVGDGHFGLEGIRERIGRFGGTMDVASVLGKGTTVKLSLPA